MDFRRQDEEEEDSDNPPPPPPPAIRESALGRPMLSPSSSLLSPRGPGGGGGGGGARNETAGSLSPNPTASTRAMDSSAGAIRYRECLRNHAASLGGHVLDGCCEFMPSSDDAFKCAACGCHRSFHRIDGDSHPSHSNPSSLYHLHDAAHGRSPFLLPPVLHPHPPPPPPPLPPTSHRHHQKQFISPPPAILELRSSNSTAGGGTMTESSSEERNAGAGPPQRPSVVTKKRVRTKFTTEQKERMLDFAERVGWRIQKQDEALVQDFCAEVGVSRPVLKVWMHNNKHSSIRKPQQQDHHDK
ncbi:zinc-finger homeodomain protein 6-like [Phoenix dactylifera]|uniref:Zinc-finger homeodomain protein 6-like n=1 Tax=Phoenix dactylifera TaxID=42345 RepID=A0A8B7CBW1_PHODC|nr:zinc-finger homeodomain protein 6-like [Phoenix dactylifera]XP_038990361.1 zinc-finger homeodomain protein 6-like [Phoenix dactylifera]